MISNELHSHDHYLFMSTMDVGELCARSAFWNVGISKDDSSSQLSRSSPFFGTVSVLSQFPPSQNTSKTLGTNFVSGFNAKKTIQFRS